MAYMAAAHSNRRGRFQNSIAYLGIWMAANPGKVAYLLTSDVDRAFEEVSRTLPQYKVRKKHDGVELMHKLRVLR